MVNSIDKDKWSIDYDNSPGEITFKYNGVECLRSTGVELGILKEKFGFEEKNRLHESVKNDTYWIETETKHPFGAEPVIKHKYEIAGNHVRVTTDIQISHQLPMEHMLIDNLFFPGEWCKIDVFDFKPEKPYTISKSEHDLNISGDIKFDFVPLIIVLTKDDGTQLEVGCGYDLWRWDIADKFEAASEFIIRKDENGVCFVRKPAIWNDEYEMQRRNFRFSWYFAWGNKKDVYEEKKITESNKLVFKKNKLKTCDDFNCQVHNFVIDRNSIPNNIAKEHSGEICFCSRSFFNIFKHWLRALFAENRDDEFDIILSDTTPGICSRQNHLANKAKEEEQLHFDYLYLFGIWEWANQYLGDSDINFSIRLDKNNILSELPSARGLFNN